MSEEKEVVLPVVSFETWNPLLLRDVLRDVNCFFDEATIEVSYGGLRIKQMDVAKVAMVDCFLLKEYFDTYYVEREGKFTVVIPDVLKAVFTGVKKDDILEMNLSDEKENIEFTVKSANGVKRRIVPVLRESIEEVPEPKFYPDACCKIMVKPFIKDLKDLEKADVSRVTLIVDRDKVLRVKGETDTASFENIYEIGKSDIMLSAEVYRESKARYKIDYLLEYALPKELTAICDVVEIAWGNDMPLKVTALGCPLSLTHYIAPEIEID